MEVDVGQSHFSVAPLGSVDTCVVGGVGREGVEAGDTESLHKGRDERGEELLGHCQFTGHSREEDVQSCREGRRGNAIPGGVLLGKYCFPEWKAYCVEALTNHLGAMYIHT